MFVFGEGINALESGKHWIHEFNTNQIILTDKTRLERNSIDQNDMLVLKRLGEISFILICSLDDELGILKSTT
jgi:hypothetical protein